MSLFCTRCGKENRDCSKYCTVCGEELEYTAGTTLINYPVILENRYEIISMVKSGAMGCVYKAKDSRLNNIVAVKQMLSSFTNPQDQHYSEVRFKEEAELLSKLKHNGLPKIIDYFIVEDPSTQKKSHYIVMEFIEGKDLETIIDERGSKLLAIEEVLDYFDQILDLLHYLHTQNPPIIYRDMNPRNIMVQNGNVFLVDFGIARVFHPQKKGTAIGTPGYAAPEQYKGESEPRSDIYALGAVIHYLLTGKNPEDSRNRLFSFEDMKVLNSSLSDDIIKIVMSMVEIIPSKRPSTAREIKDLLNKAMSHPKKNALSQHTVTAPVPPVKPKPSSHTLRKTRSTIPPMVSTRPPACKGSSDAIKIVAIIAAISIFIGFSLITGIFLLTSIEAQDPITSAENSPQIQNGIVVFITDIKGATIKIYNNTGILYGTWEGDTLLNDSRIEIKPGYYVIRISKPYYYEITVGSKSSPISIVAEEAFSIKEKWVSRPSVLVETNKESKIFLNGKEMGITANKKLNLKGLDEGTYRITAKRSDCYETEAKSVKLRKGQTQKISFELSEIPQTPVYSGGSGTGNYYDSGNHGGSGSYSGSGSSSDSSTGEGSKNGWGGGEDF